MKNAIVIGVTATTILAAGCGQKSSSISATPPAAQANSATPSSPASESALAAWQRGDKTAAIDSFLKANWNARPLFAAGSPLNLSEAQFQALSDADRQAKSKDLVAQLDSLKELAAAVAQAGHDAASKGNAAEARKYFTSLKQCGKALTSPDCLQLLQLVGKAFEQVSDAELAKVGQ